MPSIKGPGIFLAQFLRDEAPYNNLENIGKWVAGLGFKGVQIPTWDGRVFDRDQAAASKTYCDEYKGKLQEMGLEVTELAAYLSGQVLAIHPAYEVMFEGFHPKVKLVDFKIDPCQIYQRESKEGIEVDLPTYFYSL